MVNCIRTNSSDENFQLLVKFLDVDLKARDGDDNVFYAQFNTIDTIKYAIVAYDNAVPIACGAIKENSFGAMEVKRMYVVESKRGKGIASAVLKALEHWATELNYDRCVLETGKRQPEAIELYKTNGYQIIPNFGQYMGVENSICFEKILVK